jgi:hypothetical protein
MAVAVTRTRAAPAPAGARPAPQAAASRAPTTVEAPGLSTVKIAGPAARSPRFGAVLEGIRAAAARVARHAGARRKAAEAQAAAVPQPRERAAGAQANQVAAMKEAEARKPETSGFLALLRKAIEQAMPRTLDDTTRFMGEGQKAQLQGAVRGEVQAQQAAAAGPTQAAAVATPDESRVPAREVQPMAAEPAPVAPALDVSGALPEPRPAQELARFAESQRAADGRMAAADVTAPQLRAANDPRFTRTLTARESLRRQAEAAPGQYRAAEAAALAQGAGAVQAHGTQGVAAMLGVRGRSNAAVLARQLAAKQRDEARRREVAESIERIYGDARKAVEAKLDGLERRAMSRFEAGAEAALDRMKASAEKDVARFKEIRYAGVEGKARWVKDLFSAPPEGIQAILRTARDRFVAEMDALAVRIAEEVDRRVAEAKAEVARGQERIARYVAGLPADLQAVGKAAEREVAGRFEELRAGIETRQEDLARKLADKHREATDRADASLKTLEEANAGALKGFADAIGAVVRAIAEFRYRMVAVFRKGLATVNLIVAHPIVFLGNLLSAVKKGVGQFADRIWEHLKQGFLDWMFGSLAEAGIELPRDFSLGSILRMVLAVLGITYDRMRQKAVKLVGERAVSVLEKVFGLLHTLVTAGPAKLWEEMKEYLSDLKAQVIDALQSWVVTTIVKSAVTKLATMFNPVGAIVQAVITIYNVVMFFVENAKKLLALVEAIVESVAAIAAGAISGAASWIERAMARAIPVVIGFLARLLGLGRLGDKIKEIIRKVQGMVDRAVDKLIEKIVGVVKKLFAAGKAAVKAALQWWRARKAFQTEDGQEHEIYFEGERRGARLVVASKIPKGIPELVREKEARYPKEAAQARTVLDRIALRNKGTETESPAAAAIDKDLAELATLLRAMHVSSVGTERMTKVVFAKKSGIAFRVHAYPLTINPGNTTGSEAGPLAIPGWQVAGPSNIATRNVWVRAHLLSYRLHGPGNLDWNLVPATQSANQKMAQIEKKAADLIRRKKNPAILEYVTEVTAQAGKGFGAMFAKSILVKFEEKDDKGKTVGSPPVFPEILSDDPRIRLLSELGHKVLANHAVLRDLLMFLLDVSGDVADAIVAARKKAHPAHLKPDELELRGMSKAHAQVVRAAMNAKGITR